MRILHIHQDYPDGRSYPFTRAVENLIKATKASFPKIEHYIVSINRTSNPLKISVKEFDQGLSIVYWAIPLPFLYAPTLYFWSLIIRFYLQNQSFSVIHGHKLTTEGIFTYYLAKQFKLPYVISIRGGSDTHNIKRLWDLKKLFKKIYGKANHIFWVSPWAKTYIESKISCQNEHFSNLPNICNIGNIKSKEINFSRQKYCIILSYHQMKRKGLIPLLEAILELRKKGTTLELEIIGNGNQEYFRAVEKRIDELGLKQQITILGPLSHEKTLEKLLNTKALLLPALNETFGMAYIEAIACGSPVLFMANTGIDGYFKPDQIGVRIIKQDSRDIANGIAEIEYNYKQLIDSVFSIANSDALNQFKEEHISQSYTQTLEKITK